LSTTVTPGPSGSDVAGFSIAGLRGLVEQSADAEALLLLCDRLEADPRAGARELGQRTRRRLDRQHAEAERMRQLFALRATLMEDGARAIAGVDEVGVGPLAGPVVAAAVVLPDAPDLPGLNDSKKLSRQARERLDVEIRKQAVAFGVGVVSAEDVDRLNIFNASLEAMRRAVTQVGDRVDVDHLLVDARTIPAVSIRQTAIVHGDALDASIAAASIVAKVYRDRVMRDYDSAHPGYGFARHMGYGTAEHVAALGRLGASPIHRRSFAPVAAVLRD
jgi:ribonuclease HII